MLTIILDKYGVSIFRILDRCLEERLPWLSRLLDAIFDAIYEPDGASRFQTDAESEQDLKSTEQNGLEDKGEDEDRDEQGEEESDIRGELA